ncbi:flagella synthesis protein FlgN [Dokdonella sp. MW10]|uniref:flagella synthesis protein FlgN n=1 Tax=Dokdonella sp. MW10 TaxID=2992926 RepID=UPI003F7E2C84
MEAELAQALAATVGEIAATTRKLLVALEEEREALQLGDDQRLLYVTGVKTGLLQRLEALEAERAHLVSQVPSGNPPAPFAMTRALAAHPATLAAWEETVELLGYCRTLNQSNGAAVELRLRQVRQALQILSGAPPSAGLYGPQGARESLRRSNPIAKA